MSESNKEKRTPIASDFGMYLRTLRTEKNMSVAQVAEQLSLSPNTVRNVEDGYNAPPSGARLKLWLSVVGASNRLKEATALRAAVRTSRHLQYKKRDPANEHIDRLLDSYDKGTLSDLDLNLLRMIAPYEY